MRSPLASLEEHLWQTAFVVVVVALAWVLFRPGWAY